MAKAAPAIGFRLLRGVSGPKPGEHQAGIPDIVSPQSEPHLNAIDAAFGTGWRHPQPESACVGVYVVSSHMNSPRPVRRSPPNRAAAFSPWHFTVHGMVALLGTGLLAVLDRSSDRAASSHTEPLAHKGVSAPATRTAAPAETALAPLI